MHDPQTVAFNVPRPWPQRTKPGVARQLYGRLHWPTWITIWHVDPERDHTDDSCGWFPRARHGSAAVLAEIVREFTFHATWAGGWFDKVDGLPVRSNHAIALDMFFVAARIHFRGRFDKHGWRGAHRFMRRNLFDILRFAESPSDGLKETFEQHYGPSPLDARLEDYAAMVYGWILRAERPWYRHPKWHVWHWKLQIHPSQAFKRWAFSRCARCGKGFSWGYAPISHSWNGTGPLWFRSERSVYHSDCSRPSDDQPKSVGAVDPQGGSTLDSPRATHLSSLSSTVSRPSGSEERG